MARRRNRKRKPKHECKSRYMKRPSIMDGDKVIIYGAGYYFRRPESARRSSGSYFKLYSNDEIYNVTHKFHKYKIYGKVIYA